MKKFLFVLIAFFTLGLSSTFAITVEKLSQNEERTLIRIVSGDHEWVQVIASECGEASYEVVHVTEAAIILQVTRDGKKIWQTVALIEKGLLPDKVELVCIFGIEKLSAAVYEASKALIEMREGYVRKGTTYSIPWIADKPANSGTCSATIETQLFQDAADVATLFEKYAEEGCMKYKDIKIYSRINNEPVASHTATDTTSTKTVIPKTPPTDTTSHKKASHKEKKDKKYFGQAIIWIEKKSLPTSIYCICMPTIGNSRLCAVFYETSKALIEMREGYVRKGMTYGIPWTVDKPKDGKYCITIETGSFTDASDVATTLTGFKKQDCLFYKNADIRLSGM